MPPKKLQKHTPVPTPLSPKKPVHSLKFALTVTAVFFLLVITGLFYHEMWRDEYQAWLVARDASSIAGVLENMRFEGNPALWHILLYYITGFTHNPLYMQVFHLLIAGGFIFVFNRYASLDNTQKLLFSFGYFACYEYAVISRSYALGVLLAFGICALYRRRTSNYLLIGFFLALLANVTIFAVIITLGLSALLLLDYILYQEKDKKRSLALFAGLLISAGGILFSFYQILPDKDNTFPAFYATSLWDAPRWGIVASKLFVTYFYFPDIHEISFWNHNIYLEDVITIAEPGYPGWLRDNPGYLWGYVLIPISLFLSGIAIFLRKPLILFLYVSVTTGLLSVYYYTGLMYSRYCGYLLIILVICYWLAAYYPDKAYRKKSLETIAAFGKKINGPFLKAILIVNVLAAIAAYAMDIRYTFSPGRDAAAYIKENNLDTLTIVGVPDFTQSPLAAHLDKKIYYPQMQDSGSFTIYNGTRMYGLTLPQLYQSFATLMNQERTRLVWVNNSIPQVRINGRRVPLEHGIIRPDMKVDLLSKFEEGIVDDEKYYIYLIEKTDPRGADPLKYPMVN